MKYLTPLLLTTILFLQGCVPAVFVAGGAAGGAVAYDQRSMKTMLEDRNLAYQARQRISANTKLADQTNISLATFNHVVLLVGQAPTAALRKEAETTIKDVPHIKRIYNEIQLKAPSAMLTRSSDAWITTKVKSVLLANNGLKSTQLKVVTENGVVYLMGLVTRREAKLASDIASKVSGVQKVVKIFEYVY